MNKKSIKDRIAEKRDKSPYLPIAKKYNTTYNYVHQIACGGRKAVRGKALLIKLELEALAD